MNYFAIILAFNNESGYNISGLRAAYIIAAFYLFKAYVHIR